MKLSVIIPAHNEEASIVSTYHDVVTAIKQATTSYEIIFIDDGSADNTVEIITKLSKKDASIKLICLSKNFGKEVATSAGLNAATGDAALMIDADGQHPPELIPAFIDKWKNGAKVVVGVRDDYANEGFIKRHGSSVFYWLFNNFSGASIVPASTDFRLIDREVLIAFNGLQERDRITRGLIDWLGFKRDYIHFKAKERTAGEATYTPSKLVKLAFTSLTSLSFAPLYIFGYFGVFITSISLLLGLFVVVEQYLLNDPMNLNVTGSASLGILIVFLVGILLISQGIMSLYISKISAEVKKRPLYVVDKSKSIL